MKADSEIKKALAAALVDAWERGLTTKLMLIGVARDIDCDLSRVYAVLGAASGKDWVPDVIVKNYIKTNFPMLSDALWEARSNAKIINAARRAVGLKAKSGTVASMRVSTRALYKTHDWGTVK
jgi:hypothetical protein